jgi:hypothetical protein
VTKDRKQIRQMKKLMRGQRLKNAAMDAMRPATTTAIMANDEDENQKSVGAYQKRNVPISPAIAVR